MLFYLVVFNYFCVLGIKFYSSGKKELYLIFFINRLYKYYILYCYYMLIFFVGVNVFKVGKF